MVLDQVTSVQQSAMLLDMGMSDSRASFVWTTVDGFSTVVDRELCLPENIEGYAFTTDDLLEMLPDTIVLQGRDCGMSLRRMNGMWCVYYGFPFGVCQLGKSLLDCILDMCRWLEANGYFLK